MKKLFFHAGRVEASVICVAVQERVLKRSKQVQGLFFGKVRASLYRAKKIFQMQEKRLIFHAVHHLADHEMICFWLCGNSAVIADIFSSR